MTGSQTPEETLRLFNEKVDRLLSLSFFAKASDSRAIVEFTRNAGWDSVFVGPDEESIEALVLTLRLFMQDNEPLSLRNMRSLYAARLPKGLGLDFVDHCTRFNVSLDSDSMLSIEDGRQLTHRDILEIFVYGAYAHTNPQRRRTFEGLRTTAFFPVFQQTLVAIIVVFGRCLRSLQKINETALSELSGLESSRGAI